jgi:hypothetical protein
MVRDESRGHEERIKTLPLAAGISIISYQHGDMLVTELLITSNSPIVVSAV